MPYGKDSDLPDSLKSNLPHHAQDIYRATYNNAWDEYGHDEARAHSVAWSAVERGYEKDDGTGRWKKK